MESYNFSKDTAFQSPGHSRKWGLKTEIRVSPFLNKISTRKRKKKRKKEGEEEDMTQINALYYLCFSFLQVNSKTNS